LSNILGFSSFITYVLINYGKLYKIQLIIKRVDKNPGFGSYIMKCKNCGAKIRPDSKFCIFCGQPIKETELKVKKTCQKNLAN
jgi:rRNA maturation endonuclease Nob1